MEQTLTQSFDGAFAWGWKYHKVGGGNNWSRSTLFHAGTGSLSYAGNLNAANAWIYTPAQTLTAGTTYSVSFWYKVNNYIKPQKLKLTVGGSDTITAQTTVLWMSNNLSEMTDNLWEFANINFTPATSGTYYFALNCFSAGNNGLLYVDDFNIGAGSTPLSGSVNVGTSETYTSLTNTNGLFQKINFCGLSGNLIVNITSDITENGTYCLNEWKDTNYSVTIKPASASMYTLSGACSDGLIRMNGADKITIDGSFDGNGRYLSFKNTNTISITSKVIGIKSVSNNLLIKNAILINGVYGIHQSNQANSNNVISNCSIEDFLQSGIHLYGGNGTTISENTIFKRTNSTSPGLSIGVCTEDATNTIIEKNYIYDLKPYYLIDSDFPSFSEMYAAIGIQIKPLAATAATIIVTIRNNMIALTEQFSHYVVGIEVSGAIAASSSDICFNSIYIGGTVLTKAQYDKTPTPSSYCLKNLSAGAFSCKNNILYNNRTSAITERKNYAIQNNYISTTTSDYNDIYAPGTNNYIGIINTTDYQTIAAWRTASSKDVNSFNQDPFYVSTTSPFDLHIQANNGLTGVSSCSAISDIDNEARLNYTIGADETTNLLPVTLMNFNTKCDNESIIIHWQTASETNNDYFKIEKLKDQNDYYEIGRVKGAGNSNNLLDYHFVDNYMSQGYNYYRLTQVDYDGKTTIYQAISGNCNENDKDQPTLETYPNPFKNEVNVVIKNVNNGEFTLQILDDLGRIVYCEKHTASESVFKTKLNISSFRSAVYNLRFITKDSVLNRRMIKR